MDSDIDRIEYQAPLGWTIWTLMAVAAVVGAGAFVFADPGVCPAKWNPYLLAKLLLISPVLEEAAFRGGLQSVFLARWPKSIGLRGISLSNVLTSVCFTAAHVFLGNWTSAYVLLPSLALGVVFERSGKLWPCIVLHGGFNIAFVAACMLR